MEDKICFNPESYEVKTCELDGKSITYRAYENIVYCANPVDPIQKMNIYVPEALAQGETINGFTIKTAPIFMPNTVGGYMPGPAETPGRDFLGRTNTVFEGLLHGYVVVSAGVRGRTTEKEQALSGELKKLFSAYVNGLNLKDAEGNPLTLDVEGHGSFEELVKKYIIVSAQRKLDHPDEEIRQKAVPESDIEHQDSLTIIDGKVAAVDLPAYVKAITRMKKTPAFDAINLHSPENEEFGTETVFAQHFTAFSKEHSEVNGGMAEDGIIKMLNPTRYIGEADTAKHWRIRHGSFDRDTSLAIPVILATMLENAGCQVDFHLPWGLPHSGDYDLPQLFAWIDEICR